MIPTPKSEASEYFDAPLMHFHSKDNTNQQRTSPSPLLPGGGGVATETSPERSDEERRSRSPALSQRVIPRQKSADGADGWLPATDVPPDHVDREDEPRSASARAAMYNLVGAKSSRHTTDSSMSSSSLYSSPLTRKGSQRSRKAASISGRQSLFTNRDDGRAVEGSVFVGGAGTTGPNTEPEVDESVHARAASAGANLTPKQKSKIHKTEVKENKRISRIIKEEAKVEKESLSLAVEQLADLQKLQKEAVKREAKAHSMHADTLAAFQKHEQIYLAARRKYEVLQAQLNADLEALEISRNNARDATAQMQEKSREIAGLKLMLRVDESERALKLNELKGKNNGRAFLSKIHTHTH